MSAGRRKKYSVLVAVVVSSAAALLAGNQPWFSVSVAGATETSHRIDVAGSVAAPALTSLAFASLALVGALAISGPVFQFVMGLLAIAIGGCIALSIVLAFCDPGMASAPAVSAATGVSGTASLANVIISTTTTAWPILAFFSAALMVAAGLAVYVTGREWPSTSRRHNRVRFKSASDVRGTGPTPPSDTIPKDPVIAWDDLSRGTDPTK